MKELNFFSCGDLRELQVNSKIFKVWMVWNVPNLIVMWQANRMPNENY